MKDKNLGNIENGKQFPQVNNFLKIIEVLNIPLSDFGVNYSKNEQDKTKIELLKKIYEASPNKSKIYLEALGFVDKIC